MKRAVADATDLALEFRICHPKKGMRWLLGVGKTICDGARRATPMVGITLDVTERKSTEQEVHRLNNELTNQLADLQDKIGQLEQFEEMVVGRELKMIALKKNTEKLQREIERLKAAN